MYGSSEALASQNMPRQAMDAGKRLSKIMPEGGKIIVCTSPFERPQTCEDEVEALSSLITHHCSLIELIMVKGTIRHAAELLTLIILFCHRPSSFSQPQAA